MRNPNLTQLNYKVCCLLAIECCYFEPADARDGVIIPRRSNTNAPPLWPRKVIVQHTVCLERSRGEPKQL